MSTSAQFENSILKILNRAPLSYWKTGYFPTYYCKKQQTGESVDQFYASFNEVSNIIEFETKKKPSLTMYF